MRQLSRATLRDEQQSEAKRLVHQRNERGSERSQQLPPASTVGSIGRLLLLLLLLFLPRNPLLMKRRMLRLMMSIASVIVMRIVVRDTVAVRLRMHAERIVVLDGRRARHSGCGATSSSSSG